MKKIHYGLLVLVFSFAFFATMSNIASPSIAIASDVAHHNTVVTTTDDQSSVDVEKDSSTTDDQSSVDSQKDSSTTDDQSQASVQTLSAKIATPTVATATVNATKIVCDNESDLPNWGAGNGPDITSTTATDYVANHSGCKIVPWTFEWAPSGTANPGDSTGVAAGWTSFTNSTTINVPSTTPSYVWVREQADANYIPFTGVNTTQDVSAEMYCHTDHLNYDNYDRVDNMSVNGDYYCVGFNVPKDIVINNTCPIPTTLGDSTKETINTGSELSLQAVLDGSDYHLNAQNDQKQFQAWNVTGGSQINIDTKYINRFANYNSVFGYYINGDTSNFVPVFKTANITGYESVPQSSVGTFTITAPAGATTLGFAIKVFDDTTAPAISTMATENSLNSGSHDQVVVYNPESNKYVLAFEDIVGGDYDFNDLVVQVSLACITAPTNTAPIANAGPDQTITLPTNSVTLDGSGSTDSDGTITSYVWDFVSGPSTVNPDDTVSPSVTGLVEGTYVFKLTVTDNDGAHDSDTVSITVNPASNGGGQCVNNTIVSDATTMSNGHASVAVSFISPSWTASIPGATWIWSEDPLADPTARTTSVFTKTFNITSAPADSNLVMAADNAYSVDVNGHNVCSNSDEYTTINFSTTHTCHIPASDLVTGANTITFTVINQYFPNGTRQTNPAGLLYKLTVNEGSCPVNTNTAPIANAGPDQTITLPTNSVTLDGSGSTDSDGTITSYVWDFVSGPSTVNPDDTVSPSVTGLVEGTYVFKLTVTDNDGAHDSDTVSITVNPASNGGGSKPECSDGKDNDNDGLIDSADPGCHTDGNANNPNSYDPNDNDETDVVINHTSGGSSTTTGGSRPTGQVLAAENTCGIYVDKYLKVGYHNNPVTVQKVQTFLNNYQHSNLAVDGVYGLQTEAAVKAFQVARAENVLHPWGISNEPTGIFYLTTQTEVNNIMCPTLNLPIPASLINFSLNAATQRSTAATITLAQAPISSINLAAADHHVENTPSSTGTGVSI